MGINRAAWVLGVAVATIALGGCGGEAHNDPPQRPKPTKSVDEYEQTWTKPYAETSCGDYLSKMDDHQKTVAAFDILTTKRGEIGVTKKPAKSLVTRFKGQTIQLCGTNDNAKRSPITTWGDLIWSMNEDTYKY